MKFTYNRRDAEDTEQYLLKKYGSKMIDRSYMEVNAQIHTIYQLYREHKIKWNTLNIFQMIALHGSLIKVYETLSHNKDDLSNWLRLLVTRMSREGILGDNMNYIPWDTNYIYERSDKLVTVHENFNNLGVE